MKSFGFWLMVSGVLCVVGCQGPQDNLPLVSFQENVPITYKMVSDRDIQFDLTTSKPSPKSKPTSSSEKLELVLVYTPVEVDPFGASTIKVECKSSKVTRSQTSGKTNLRDAMEKFGGKSFVLKVSPTGEIIDTSDLERITKELGDASFTSGRGGVRIKQPDMISDFIAMQQYLWGAGAAISTQPDLKIGDTWQSSKQLVPWPKPMYPPPARIATYTLDSIDAEANQPRKAVISSTFALSETPMEDYIRPYEKGKFQMQGLLGFLRNHQFKRLEGTGKQIFNLDDGLVESDQQEYTMNIGATFMMPLGDSVPVLTVNQTISIERIETP